MPKIRTQHSSSLDLKEEIVRLAELNNCNIEVVKSGDAMSIFDGVGCLPCYLAPERDDKLAA